MGGKPRNRDRDGGAGAGDLHGDGGFQAGVRGLHGEAHASIRGRLMADKSFLEWPFFDNSHRELAAKLERWCEASLGDAHGANVDAECRALVRSLGEGGWLRYCVPAAYGGVHDALDVRSLALIRETLAR